MREKDGVGVSPLLQVVLPVFGVQLVIFSDLVGFAQAVEILTNVIDGLKYKIKKYDWKFDSKLSPINILIS